VFLRLRLRCLKIALSAIVGQAELNSVGLLLHADAAPQVTQEGEMIHFLAQMPTDTMLFLAMAVLGLAATLIVLKWLI
jgi:hypothetical protein